MQELIQLAPSPLPPLPFMGEGRGEGFLQRVKQSIE